MKQTDEIGAGLLQYLDTSARFAFVRDGDHAYLGLGPGRFVDAVPDTAAFLARRFDGHTPAEEWRGFARSHWWIPDTMLRSTNGRIDVLSGVLPDARPNDVTPIGAVSFDWSDDAYVDRVRQALTRIHASEFAKLVIARRELLSAEGAFHPHTSLENLIRRFPTCIGFAFGKDDQCFLGATPEVLVRVEGGTVFTDALAGSAARGASEESDAKLGDALMNDAKERAEHQWVVDMIRESLQPWVQSLEIPDAPGLRRLSNVQHLHTPISGQLAPEVSIDDLVAALHPTPAVGGWPKAEAAAAIHQIEGFDRGLYAGVVGISDPERNASVAAVAIRSALLRGNKAWAYAGAGIVDGSDPEREARETQLKLGAVVEALS